MAFLGTTFDAHSVEPSAPRELLPAGKYHVQIVKSEMRDNKNTVGRHLWLEMAVIDGQHANQRVFDRLNLENNSADTVEIAQRTLSAICRAIGQMSVTDSEQLHNRSMIANVKVRPEGPDKNGVMRNAANEIGGYEPIGGRPTASAQPAQTAPQLENADSAAAKPATPPWRRVASA